MAPPLRLLVPWSLLLLVGLTVGLGSSPLRDPDEGRNAEVAREMAESGNYVLPSLNGLPYLDKPVFFFAVTALSIELFGADPLAVRAVPFLFFAATVLLVGSFGRRLFGPAGGWIAALSTATIPWFFAFGQIVIMDSTLCFFVVSALISFYRAIEGRRGVLEQRLQGPVGRDLDWRLHCALAWGAIGVGILVKGPVALAVPLLVALPYSLWRRAALALWHPAGPALAVAIAAPWVVLVERQVPGFLRYVLVTETVSRMTSDELNRSEPYWYYLPHLLGAAFPWSVVVLSFLWPRPRPARDSTPAGLRHAPEMVYLLLWLLVPLVFFSLSSGKMPQYLLPALPSLGLLVAGQWVRHDRPIGAGVAAVGWGSIGVVLLVLAALRDRFELSPEIAPQVTRIAFSGAAIFLVAALLAWLARRHLWWALIALTVPCAAAFTITTPLLDAMADERSARRIAEAIASEVDAGAELVGVREYSGSLAFYLGRTYPVLTRDCDELRSNYLRTYCGQWVRADGLFRPFSQLDPEIERCEVDRIYLVTRRDTDLRRRFDDAGMEPIDDRGKVVAYRHRCRTTGASRGELD